MDVYGKLKTTGLSLQELDDFEKGAATSIVSSLKMFWIDFEWNSHENVSQMSIVHFRNQSLEYILFKNRLK